MNRSPYSAYRGRKSVLQRVLIAIVILLVVALALATVALFVLPRYVVDTPNGPQLVLPLFGSGPSSATPDPVQTAEVSTEPTVPATDGNVVVEPPSATPTPTPSPAPDLSNFPRRDLPLGLVVAAGAGPREQDGYIFDFHVPGGDPSGSVELYRSLLYCANYINPDWDSILKEDATARTTGFADYIANWCLTYAASGCDELILADTVTADNDPKGEALAALYRRVKKELDDAGWQGRLGLVLNQDLFDAKYDDDLIPAIAQSFDRLYFRTTLKTANKNALTSNGFTANGYTLVTVVQNVANLNYAWAILP